jgi:CRISPR-associated endonuclease Cas2
MSHFIISYDISSTALRTKIGRMLEREGCSRIQKSVFIAPNFEEDDLEKLKIKIHSLLRDVNLSSQTDSIVCFPIRKKDISEMVWDGSTDDLKKIMEKLLFLMI